MGRREGGVGVGGWWRVGRARRSGGLFRDGKFWVGRLGLAERVF